MVRWTTEADFGEVRDETLDAAIVDASASGNGIQSVEHLEEESRGLVDGADDGAAFFGEPLEQRHALGAGGAVQATKPIIQRETVFVEDQNRLVENSKKLSSKL